jgi:pyridoxal phosphate enzyme (YggS family)
VSPAAEPHVAGRATELAGRLAAIRARIAAACAAAGRDPAELTLIAVTKTYPASDVIALAGLGVTDVGENRDQEAAAKAAAVSAAGAEVRWHFVGQLQTNKARSVAGYADFVHSVDRVRLARALGAAARAAGRELTCLVQVSLDPADAGDLCGAGSGSRDAQARGGVPPAMAAEVAEAIEGEPGLVLGGLMAVAPRFTDPATAFAPLRQLSDLIRSVSPSATMVSAGMSGDLEAAIGGGATHLRIGTALLGDRRLPVL